MDTHLVLMFVILGVAVALFLSERLAPDLVALLTVISLGATGILTPREVFAGLSSSPIITIIAILILAQGLTRSGVTDWAGQLLLRISGPNETRLIITTMVGSAFLSLFMNNIAALAVLMPGVTGAARKANVNPRRLLMPLAFGTLLGGMATLLTTTNLVVSGILVGEHLPEFHLLSFAPVGLPLAVAGIVYMAIWGRHRLPKRTIQQLEGRTGAPLETDLAQLYYLSEYLLRARVAPGSTLNGRTLAETNFRQLYGVTVTAIHRDGRVIHSPEARTILQEGDVLVLAGEMEEFVFRSRESDLEILPFTDWRKWQDVDLESHGMIMVEAVLSPRSRLIDQTLRSAHFREKYGMTVLSVWRAGRQIYAGLRDLPLAFGDALLLQGPADRLPLLKDEPDLILLSRPDEVEVAVPGKGRLALAIMVLTLALVATGKVPIGMTMMGGAMIMVLAGVLTMDQAYDAIEWRAVFLIAAMLPLGLAMSRTGAAALLAKCLIAVLGPAGPVALLAGLMLLTVLMSQAIKGAAVCAVVAPIAIHTATQLHVNPLSMAMGVALATSMAFATPLGHPVNILVMGEGRYRFRDFARVGIPLTIILLVLATILTPIFWPLSQ